MRRTSLVTFAVLLAPGVAAAHIRITSPTPRSSTVLKDRHCGMAGLPRANVHTARPGSALHLEWDEYVQHPGWFRIAFQQNGDTFEIPPASNGKTGTGNASNFPTENRTGQTDVATGSVILVDRIPDGTTRADIVLPDVECTNCTLQVIQVMNDKPPYSELPGSNDIYFACVDLVLSANAPDPGPGGGLDAGVGTDGGGVGGGGNDAGIGGGGGGGDDGNGCSVGGPGGTGGALLALAVGLAASRRRRCRRRP
jgi:MYXO-CTERM domain-containing protein